MSINLTDQHREELNRADFALCAFDFDGEFEYLNSKADRAYVAAKVKDKLQRGGKLVGYIGLTYHPGEGNCDVLIVPRDERLKHIADELIASVKDGGLEHLLGEGESVTIQ